MFRARSRVTSGYGALHRFRQEIRLRTRIVVAAFVVAAFAVAAALTGCAKASTLPTDVIVGPSAFSEQGTHLAAAKPAVRACTPKGGSTSFPVDRVVVSRSGSGVVVAMRLPGLPVFTKSAVATLRFTDRSGRHGGTYTTQWIGQNLSPDVVVTEDSTKRRAYLQVDPVITATSITTRFPALPVDRLGEGWRWTFTSTVDGRVQATCGS